MVESAAPRLVLVGGGHAHIHVFERCILDGPPEARLTLVVDRPIAVYSGMVPGFVAGQYEARELEIDAVALAERVGAEVVVGRATSLDPDARTIEVDGHPPVPYDLASFDIGSTVTGLDLPGVAEHALPTRPIVTFVERIVEIVERARTGPSDEPFRVLVVGGGAGGVEVAFTVDQRIRDAGGRRPQVGIVEYGPRILARYSGSLVRRVHRAARNRGIHILCNVEVLAAEEGAVAVRDGDPIPFDALIWVTGPTSHGVFGSSPVATDDRGFALIRPTLQLRDHDDLFAVGDCASFIDYPETPKAGVYAVREGEIIADNLYASVAGRPLREYRPQGDFLTLMNLGDGRAIGAKWGFSFQGRWVMRWKDRIDRKFMVRFQALAGAGT